MEKSNRTNDIRLFKKLFHEKLTKNEMDDVFFYYKQVIGLIAGIISGILRIKGIWGFLFFFILQFLTSFALYNRKIHENYFLDNYNIATSNVLIALSAFLISWVTINTLLI
ncbi:Rab5-interacting protein, putative [Plasmodium malariae]|uniref:Rab5-interacting protein, putative n=1 Tax=Plasmodium malariae TaxID=5858 RepID=A0A1D3JLF4_PLAMA|nr:Rab5-interacting protein, putative [Plasmodium malariae]SBT87431.1 Rab5-interacting protein, putative [Plasmodium malariae]